MKPHSALLVASLAANAVFAAWFLSRPPRHPGVVTPTATVARAATPAGTLSAAQIAALQSGDPAQLAAAGVPGDIANILAAGRAYANLSSLQRTQKKLRVVETRYWRSDSPLQTETQRKAETKAEEEFEVAMRRAFPDYEADDTSAERYPFLPPAAREKLARIEKDYDEFEQEIRTRAEPGPLLPSDTAKLKLLQEERRRDIAAALSPGELEELQLHDSSSDTVRTIRTRYGNAIESEADYRKIFALQKTFDDRYGFKVGQGESAERLAANAQLQADILEVIGEENYAAFQRARDQSYRDLEAVTKRLDLPGSTPDAVYALRDRYALQSQAIYGDTSLSDASRGAQLKELAEKGRADVEAKLGTEAAEAYATRTGSWLSVLRDGRAFSTNPKDAPIYSDPSNTVYPLSKPRR